MKMSGSQIIQAPRQVVWKGLNNPKVLQQCIPGCEAIDAASPTEMSARVLMKVGPVKALFKGAVTLSDIVAPESYRISGQGQGGLAGFASGGATVKLAENGSTETLMEYDVDAQIGGKLAMLGSRLIDTTARSLAEQFFSKFAAMMRQAHSSASATKTKLAKKTKATPTRKKLAAKKPTKSKEVATKTKKKAIKSRSR